MITNLLINTKIYEKDCIIYECSCTYGFHFM